MARLIVLRQTGVECGQRNQAVQSAAVEKVPAEAGPRPDARPCPFPDPPGPSIVTTKTGSDPTLLSPIWLRASRFSFLDRDTDTAGGLGETGERRRHIGDVANPDRPAARSAATAKLIATR
jgi:hypothetical protein